MSQTNPQALQALQNSRHALQNNDRQSARRWAQKAAQLAPENEEPWLILAALASPRASLVYLQRALNINPTSQRARQGMHWAIKRQKSEPSHISLPLDQRLIKPRKEKTPPTSIQSPNLPIPLQELVQPRPAFLVYTFIFLTLAMGFTIWYLWPGLMNALLPQEPLSIAQVSFAKASPTFTATFTPTATSTPTPTSTPTNTPTATNTPTFTPTATFTPSPTLTNTPKPKKTKKAKKQAPAAPSGRPSVVGLNENWIDVNLTTQTTHAMTGDQLMRTFVVSTGTWRTPTVTGVYRIYVKYRTASMSGADYFLPNVPYVMYFYKGYGIHGTYWHSNFGTPMSHGCVNLSPNDAGWLFEFAKVGTVVQVHY